MKKIFTLFVFAFVIVSKGKSQVIINELYTDPGSGKHEFFELYNPEFMSISMNNYTLMCFYDNGGTEGWLVMDLPNITVSAKGYFVGSSAIPFNFQGVTGSTASDFSWNSAAFTLNEGSIKKWVPGTLNLLDGNPYYDQAALPVNFNDFLFRRTQNGASYSVFLYRNGVLINSFIGGAGGQTSVLPQITAMPNLYVDMAGSSPDFTINFSGYGSLPVEATTQDAGSDNGFIRDHDGACGAWKKSSSQLQHTPKATNGTWNNSMGTISVAAAISPGTAATGSWVNYDIVGGPSTAFPVEMQIYMDIGTTTGLLDAGDVFVEANTETNINQGPFYTHFFPYNASILVVVRTNAGCLDRINYIPNSIVLGVNMISFQGTQNKNEIRLNWTVEENESLDHFEVEKSINGADFISAGLIFTSGQAGKMNYSFTEKVTTTGSITYRLRIVDRGHQSGYSKSLVFETGNVTIRILANPASDRLSFSFYAASDQVTDIKVIDMNGRVMLQQKLNSKQGTNLVTLPLSSRFTKGLYIVDLFDGRNHYTDRIIKQ